MKPAALLLLGMLNLTLPAAESAPLKLTQTIPLPGVKGRFDHFAIDSKGNRLFVAALGNNTLEVIDLAAGKHAVRVEHFQIDGYAALRVTVEPATAR